MAHSSRLDAMLVRRGLLCSRRLVACPNASEEGCGSSGHATSCSPSSCYCATYASPRGFGFGLGLEPLPPPPRPPPPAASRTSTAVFSLRGNENFHDAPFRPRRRPRRGCRRGCRRRRACRVGRDGFRSRNDLRGRFRRRGGWNGLLPNFRAALELLRAGRGRRRLRLRLFSRLRTLRALPAAFSALRDVRGALIRCSFPALGAVLSLGGFRHGLVGALGLGFPSRL